MVYREVVPHARRRPWTAAARLRMGALLLLEGLCAGALWWVLRDAW